MTKKQTDWAKMIQYGKWLERLTGKKNLENWDIKPQFEDAIELLDIKYKFKVDHPFFIMLEHLTKERINWTVGIEEIFNYKDSPNFVITRTFVKLESIIRSLHYLFRSIAKDGRPWNISFYELTNNMPNQEEDLAELLSKTNKILLDSEEREDKGEEKWSSDDKNFLTSISAMLGLDEIEALYSKVGDKIIVSPHGCKIVKVLLTDYDLNKNNKQPFTTDNSHCLPLDIIVSRIFFDFLILGGQDYYGYCKYCDGFYIAERKGRKKFCSDVCRTMNQR